MKRSTEASIFVALAVVAATAPAAPPPPKAQAQAQAVSVLPPDIWVRDVWIGKSWDAGGIEPGLQPLGHEPRLGEPVSLGCDIGFSGNLPPNRFNVAFYIDEVRTCGEGVLKLQNPPVCEYRWMLNPGKCYISWVAHQAGTHTFRCGVDVDNEVTERNERNNSLPLSFTVPLSAGAFKSEDLKVTTVKRFPPGPRIVVP